MRSKNIKNFKKSILGKKIKSNFKERKFIDKKDLLGKDLKLNNVYKKDKVSFDRKRFEGRSFGQKSLNYENKKNYLKNTGLGDGEKRYGFSDERKRFEDSSFGRKNLNYENKKNYVKDRGFDDSEKRYGFSDEKKRLEDRSFGRKTFNYENKKRYQAYKREENSYGLYKKNRLNNEEKLYSDRKENIRDQKEKFNFKLTTENSLKENEGKQIRLNRYISNSGLCSRRQADEFIEQGFIKVNGKICSKIGNVISKEDVVTYKGKVLFPEEKVYVVLNKPRDFVTTNDDERDRDKVIDLLKGVCKERIYSIGRLDKDSTGVLIFTNDGDLTKNLSHPSSCIKKTYQISLDRDLLIEDLNKIKEGKVVLSDGKVLVDKIEINSLEKNKVSIEIHNGKNRILRRLFDKLGYEVKKLDRVSFAGITYKKIARGKWRHLDKFEIINLKKISGFIEKKINKF